MAPKAAVEKVRAINRQRRDETLEEAAAHASAIAVERAEEQARKDDLIRQIRALERVPKPKIKVRGRGHAANLLRGYHSGASTYRSRGHDLTAVLSFLCARAVCVWVCVGMGVDVGVGVGVGMGVGVFVGVGVVWV